MAFDTETTSLKLTELKLEGVSFCDGKTAGYIFLADYENGYINEEYDLIIQDIVNYLNRVELLIGHNIVYDLKVMYKYGFKNEPELFCTLIAHHILNETSRHGLKDLAAEYLGVSTTKFTDIKDHSSQEFMTYAINDAVWTWELAVKFREQLKQEGQDSLFRDIEMPFQYVLRDMSIVGMLVDVDKVVEGREQLKKDIDVLHTELKEIAGVDDTFNFNSSKQLVELLYTKLGLPIYEYTPSGKPSAGAAALNKLVGKSDVVAKLLQYKRKRKLLTSYFEENAQILSNLENDGRVRPNFLDFGTATGRLSCQAPNLQQLPDNKKDEGLTRSCFIVPHGYKMITCDYSGQELRVLAEVSQEPVLIDTFNKGKDMHLSTANDFFNLGIPEHALYTSNPEHEGYKEKFKSERSKAKTINFGMAYGKGAYGFAKDFEISEEEAEEILSKYFAALPKVKEAIEEAYDNVKKNGEVTSLTGRKRRFSKVRNRYGGEIYPSSAFRQSFNFLIQGYSADMIRIALTKVRDLSKRHPEWDLNVIATVHDEGVMQVKEKYMDEASKAIREEFEKAVELSVPVVADIGIGNSYAEAK